MKPTNSQSLSSNPSNRVDVNPDIAQQDWHACDEAETLRNLDASVDGLTAQEAVARLAQYGPNELPATARKSVLQRLLAQINNLLIYVLIGAAVISASLGHMIDASVILAVVVLNAVIGFVQEGRAEHALEAIRGMINQKASLLRQGHRLTLPAAEIVPGDVLLLEAGDRVAADVRLIKTRNLRIDEAILTGESVPVEKVVDVVAPNALLGDRNCIAYSGTLITAGLGTGIVVETGPRSELGRISVLLGRVEQLETPLIRQMNNLASLLTMVILGLSAATMAFAVLVRNYSLSEAFMVMVGMAVAAIPEGLPAVMTITLAIGVQRMATRNAIIRRLPAVETLGSVSTICSDKTGTFTRNEMMVAKVVLANHILDVGGAGYAPKGGFSIKNHEIDPADDAVLLRLARAALLCNDASLRRTENNSWTIDGDPMEGALVTLGLKAGYDHDKLTRQFTRFDEIPFDARYRYMATLHHGFGDTALACIKGAPENMLEMCISQMETSGEAPINKQYWSNEIDKLAQGGTGCWQLHPAHCPLKNTILDLRMSSKV